MYASPTCGCASRRRALLGRYDADLDDLGDTEIMPNGDGGGGGGGGYVPSGPTAPGDAIPTLPPVGGLGDPLPTLPPATLQPGGTIITTTNTGGGMIPTGPGGHPAPLEVDYGPPAGAGDGMLEWILSAVLAAALVSRR